MKLTVNTLSIGMGVASVMQMACSFGGRNKMSLYDGRHRVPCIIRWHAGNLLNGTEISDLVQLQDILPTILDLCDVKQKKNFNGISVVPLLRGKKQKELDERITVVQYGRQPSLVLEMPKRGDACVMWNKTKYRKTKPKR